MPAATPTYFYKQEMDEGLSRGRCARSRRDGSLFLEGTFVAGQSGSPASGILQPIRNYSLTRAWTSWKLGRAQQPCKAMPVIAELPWTNTEKAGLGSDKVLRLSLPRAQWGFSPTSACPKPRS